MRIRENMGKKSNGLLAAVFMGILMSFWCVQGDSEVQGAVFVPAPSARIEFEDEPVRIIDGRGYFNTMREAKIMIVDASEFFDSDAASAGIRICVQDSEGVEISDKNTVKSEIVIGDWTHKGDVHTTTVFFGADGNYTWQINYTNLAGKHMKKVSTGSSVTPYQFTIDRGVPSGSVCAVSEEGETYTWEFWRGTVNTVVSSKEKITISVLAHDAISDVSVFYYKMNCGTVPKKVLTREDLDGITNWKAFDTVELTKDQSSMIYFKCVDSLGNYTYINTDYLKIDGQSPIIQNLTSHIAVDSVKCRNGIYSDDVRIQVRAKDLFVGCSASDIKAITYRVLNMGVETQSGILAEFSAGNQISGTWEGEFIVDSKKNNSNDVKVKILVEDNTGNISTEEILLKIDTSAPVVEVLYDNTSAVNGKYYSESRTATILIRERNLRIEDIDIEIRNSEAVLPVISEWTKRCGSGNFDDTEWMANVLYVEDGDYTFELSCHDLAGNRVDLATESFTIDKTLPVLSVSYNNNAVRNQNYYRASRTATLEIIEHNLDLRDVDIQIEAISETGEQIVPQVRAWESKGDTHRAEILYISDGAYKCDITVRDKAGNQAEDFVEEIFYIDTTPPSIEIEGVSDNSSNKGEICPKIVCKDSNYFKDGVKVSLKNLKGEEVPWIFEESEEENGICYRYESVSQEKGMDGNYILVVSMTDKAGNDCVRKVRFSVNRFGSSYELAEGTEKLNLSYVNHPMEVVIREKNVDFLRDTKIILFKNEGNILLERNKDYCMEVGCEESGLKQYTYTIYKENFLDSGIYQIFVSSEDEAGNVSGSNSEAESFALRFGVDKVKPNRVITNLKEGEVYKTDSFQVTMIPSDNFVLDRVEVYLDCYDKVYKAWDARELEEISEDGMELKFDIPGDSVSPHKMKVVCTDLAGNQSVDEILDFYVTTNPWVELLKNRWIVGGIFGGMAVNLGIIFRILLKKRINPLSNFVE